MNFENSIRSALNGLTLGEGNQIQIERIEKVANADGSSVWYVNFTVLGTWASPGRFTFPFDEAVPLEESVEALADLVSNSWLRLQSPPPVRENTSAGASGD